METARAVLDGAENGLSTAIDDAAARARQPGSGGSVEVDPTPPPPLLQLAASSITPPPSPGRPPATYPLGQVGPAAALIDEECKLLTVDGT